MTRALLGTASEDIGRTACRLAEDVSGAMPRIPEEKEHDCDGEAFTEVGHPTNAVAVEGETDTTLPLVAVLMREEARRLSPLRFCAVLTLRIAARPVIMWIQQRVTNRMSCWWDWTMLTRLCMLRSTNSL